MLSLSCTALETGWWSSGKHRLLGKNVYSPQLYWQVVAGCCRLFPCESSHKECVAVKTSVWALMILIRSFVVCMKLTCLQTLSCSGTRPVGLETGPLDSTASCVQNRRQVKVTWLVVMWLNTHMFGGFFWVFCINIFTYLWDRTNLVNCFTKQK